MVDGYKNVTTSDHPALIVYILDISSSMRQTLQGGKTRIRTVEENLYAALQEMVARSLIQGEIKPRYRIAIYAYFDEVYDVLSGINTIDVVANMGIPDLKPQTRKNNMAAAFHYARELITDDIAKWSQRYLELCPAPLIVHMTGTQVYERFENPELIARDIKTIKVPDGHALIENIFITGEFAVPTQDIKLFPGYKTEEILDNLYAQMLLRMSSKLPETYRNWINKQEGMSLQSGTAMLFPGMTPEFVRSAFSMCAIS
jgi:hypothetical protein